nr:MAG TPA: hypothetical protein [Caudoviricetes sp.]
MLRAIFHIVLHEKNFCFPTLSLTPQNSAGGTRIKVKASHGAFRGWLMF